MNLINIVLLCVFVSCSSLHAAQKVEVKYAITDLMQLASPVLDALKSGSDHPDIIRRGFVVQEYLAVTKKNIARVFKVLEDAKIPFGTKDELDLFIFPGKTQEIRLMQKCIKERGVVKEFYQITMFGPGGISCARVETPQTLNADQLQSMQSLFIEFRPEVSSIARKVFFEVAAGDVRSVEVDIFLSSQDGKLRPCFIDGEIKFHEALEADAKKAAEDYRKHPFLGYLNVDITDEPRCKARNIALGGVPAALLARFDAYKQANQFHTSKIVSEYKTWANSHITSLVCDAPPGLIGTFLQKRVLLNAEAFGFGPTAAIAELFPYLRDRIAHLGYIGCGHTLDLQSKLPYDSIYDLGETSLDAKKARFLEIAQNYDVFITASDYEAAVWANNLGMTLIIYDPLTWYWRELPEVISKADFYVAQNFFGVIERLDREAVKFPESAVVPAIISGLDSSSLGDEATLLVNLGGLSNPHVSNEALIAYARVVLSAIREVMEPAFGHTYYVSSKAIANGVKDVCPVASMLPHQVQKILSSSKLAVMTSGLGNIFEASSMKKHVLWLPPANDSQGQQCILLQQHHMVDFAIDWHDILEGEPPINYFADQQQVLKQIAHCMQKLAASPAAQSKLKERLLNVLALDQVTPPATLPALCKLAETFEVGGAKACAESIVQFLGSNSWRSN